MPWSPLPLKNHCGDTTSIAFLFFTALPYAPAAMACHRLWSYASPTYVRSTPLTFSPSTCCGHCATLSFEM